MWLLIVSVMVRRGLRGLPIWTPRLMPFAARSVVPLLILVVTGLPLDWAQRRARWWAHAIAGAAFGPVLVLAKVWSSGEKWSRSANPFRELSDAVAAAAPLAGTAAAIFSVVFVLTYLLTPRDRGRMKAALPSDDPVPIGGEVVWERPAKATRMPAPSTTAPFTEQEFAAWSRQWVAARLRQRRIEYVVSAVWLITGAVLWLLFKRDVVTGGVAVLVHALSGLPILLALLPHLRATATLKRACTQCRSPIEDPEAVMYADGKCFSCGGALYVPA